MQTPSVKTTHTHAFSYSRVDFNKVNKYIIENPFSPYCCSNCDKLLETWYEWLHEIMLATIIIRTNHRKSLPICVTSPTSCIIRKLKSLQRKLTSEPSPALRNKVRSLEDLVASKINEDLMLYEESIFKSRQFSTIKDTYAIFVNLIPYRSNFAMKTQQLTRTKRKAFFLILSSVVSFRNLTTMKMNVLLNLPENLRYWKTNR